MLELIDTLRLETLHLCAIDLRMLLPHLASDYEGLLDFFGPTIDWNHLVILHLESCDNLCAMFIQFQDQPTFTLTNLQTFIIRHETMSMRFHDSLENFLVHLSPLRTCSNSLFEVQLGLIVLIVPSLNTSFPALITNKKNFKTSFTTPNQLHSFNQELLYLLNYFEKCKFKLTLVRSLSVKSAIFDSL